MIVVNGNTITITLPVTIQGSNLCSCCSGEIKKTTLENMANNMRHKWWINASEHNIKYEKFTDGSIALVCHVQQLLYGVESIFCDKCARLMTGSCRSGLHRIAEENGTAFYYNGTNRISYVAPTSITKDDVETIATDFVMKLYARQIKQGKK